MYRFIPHVQIDLDRGRITKPRGVYLEVVLNGETHKLLEDSEVIDNQVCNRYKGDHE